MGISLIIDGFNGGLTIKSSRDIVGISLINDGLYGGLTIKIVGI